MRRVRSLAGPAPWAMALTLAAAVLLAGSADVYWTGDFFTETYFPVSVPLLRGDAGVALSHLPGYGTFTVVVTMPTTLLAGALGGSETMVLRLAAVPGMLALAALGAHLATEARRSGGAGWLVVAALVAGGPIGYQTVLYGHPEDLLAGAACVGAVLCALAGRTGWTVGLLVAGVAAKQWAVLAIAPAALAAPRGGVRVAVAAVAGAVAVILPPMLLVPHAAAALTTTGTLFHPHCVWWPAGVPAPPEFTAAGHGVRTAPAWLPALVRPMIVATGTVLALVWWARAGAGRRREDALALLALVLLVRCQLDPWNLVYYQGPCVLALVAWEVRRGRPYPWLGLAVSAATWLSFVTYAERETDGPFLLYLGWSLPLAAWLGVGLLRRPAAVRPAVRDGVLPAAA